MTLLWLCRPGGGRSLCRVPLCFPDLGQVAVYGHYGYAQGVRDLFSGVTKVEHEGRRLSPGVVVEVGLPRVPALLGAPSASLGLDLAEDPFAELVEAIAGAALGDGAALDVGERVLGEGLDVQHTDVFQPEADVALGLDDPGPTWADGPT